MITPLFSRDDVSHVVDTVGIDRPIDEIGRWHLDVTMQPGTIHLYVIDLDVDTIEYAACKQLLTANELERAARFRQPKSRKRWIVSRARLRQALATHTDTLPQALVFEQSSDGKPAIVLGDQIREIHFNLSHSENLAMVAITELGPVGIDVEFERDIRDWRAVAARFFSPNEQAQLASLDVADRQHGFYCCWTRKEAVVKATGEGLRARLDSFDVLLSPRLHPKMLDDRRAQSAGRHWQLHHLEPKSGYVGALALDSLRSISLCHDTRWTDA